MKGSKAQQPSKIQNTQLKSNRMNTPQKNIVTNAVAQEVASGTTALERKPTKFSLIWVVPLIALMLTGLLIWNSTFNNGPVIHITLPSAEGIEEGKTLIKTRSVTVGVVNDVVLSPDYRNIVLTVQMDKNTEDLLRADTRFWVVKPRIESAGISGLDTLLSGSYIQLSMGTSDAYASDFVALDEPPIRQNNEEGLMISLYANDSRKLSNGDIVSFRGFNVGAITETRLDIANQQIHYRAFIREPYDKLVNLNTKFWISSGFEFDITTSGASLRTESIDNLVVGGITFDNFIDNSEIKGSVPDNTTFRLFTRRDDARVSALEGSLLYVVMLEDSIHNIRPGSIVVYRGVKVGEVVKAPWFEDGSQVFSSKALPVLIAIDSNKVNKEEISSILDGYLKTSSLCARVGSANLVLNNNQIDLTVDPNNKCIASRDIFKIKGTKTVNGMLTYNSYNVIPLIPMQSLSAQLDAFMAKMNEFDVAGLSTELQNSLRAFSAAMNSFTSSNNAVERTQVISKLADAFENFNNSVKGYGPETELYKTLHQNLKNIEQILQDLSPAISEVGQSPKSIIFGSQEDPIPRSPKGKQNITINVEPSNLQPTGMAIDAIVDIAAINACGAIVGQQLMNLQKNWSQYGNA